ncbi:hypothetical protein [Amaricoccus sp. W119]|uniref:hypothetical protein n=1 Tax=Amaricoccus sp. W119 TaxID=3391833 RepID=UPI0039A68C0E
MESGGLAAMLFALRGMDLGGWHPREDVPQTEALAHQKELSMSLVDEFIADLLEGGVLPTEAPRKDAPRGSVQAECLWMAMRELVPRLKDWSSQKLAIELQSKWAVEKDRIGRDRVRVFPPLAEMRRVFEERYGSRSWAGGADSEWAYTDSAPF